MKSKDQVLENSFQIIKNLTNEVIMKFSLNIDALSKENNHLKFIIKMQFCVVLILLLEVIFQHSQVPLMIQSSTRGLEVVQPVDFERSEFDIQSAAELMLKARFNTDSISANLFLSDKQLQLRENEQKELKNRNMLQAIVIREIKISKDQALVDLDRVIAVGDIRSAIRTRLKIAFEETEPNELNPYGLVLSFVEAQNTEVKK